MARILRTFGYSLLALVGLVTVFVLGERALWNGRVLAGVHLTGVGVAGDDMDEARRTIAQRAADLEQKHLVATAGETRFSFTSAAVGLDIDEQAALTAVRRAGRQGNPLGQAAGVLLRRFRSDEVRWRARYDEERLTRTVDEWAAEFDTPPRDGMLRLEGGAVIAEAPQPGRKLIRPAARELVRRALHGQERVPLRLPIDRTQPAIGQAEVDRVAHAARRVLAAPATLLIEGRAVELSPARLGQLLRVSPDGSRLHLGLPEANLHEALRPALAGIEWPARDARFVVEGEPPVIRVEDSAPGRELDAAPIAEALLRGEHRIEGRLRDVAPHLDTERARGLRIFEAVSTFTTEHPAGQPRVQNIHRVADLLQGRVIQPGERFSLNDAVGPRTRKAGFVKAPVIYEGEFTQDIGGGVSQFATTFFNTAFFGGYKIVTHKPHTYYISRYPMGREATVSFPNPDLVIENDSTSGILVRTSYTDSSITVTFFGDKEGRNVRAEGPKVGRRTGKGFSVEVFRVIERPGSPAERQRFATFYKAQPRKAPRPAPPPGPAPPPPGGTPPPPSPPGPVQAAPPSG